MLESFSGNAAPGYCKLYQLPTLGYLSRNGKRMIVGDKFGQADIKMGVIRYHHTVPFELGAIQAEDSFKFTLWDTNNGNITAASYSRCMPQGIGVPEDGIYTFAISIRKATRPSGQVWPEALSLLEEGSFRLTYSYLDISEPGYELDEIIHTIAEPLTNGYISVRGNASKSFTQADLSAGDVVYHNTRLGDGTDVLKLTTCNINSRCTSFELKFAIRRKFRQTGDNIIYAEVGTAFNWTFQSNAEEAVWTLKGGVMTPPKNAAPTAGYIIEWSTYSRGATVVVDPANGHGWDKLPEYRNLKEQFYWDGGLPLGMVLSNVGYIETADRRPSSLAGNQAWKLPLYAGSYPFELTAYDPRTGESHSRRYVLVLTDTGLSIDGLTSESRDL